MAASQAHPDHVLFQGEKPFPILPAVDHYAGSEKLMKKALSVQHELGPVFDMVGLTPALEVADASTDHQGDDISVEAIADSNPDWILVMDRDAAVSADDPSYKPANEILESSEALANVPAVQNSQIIYMPADTYTNEGIQTYIEFLNTFADALEKAK